VQAFGRGGLKKFSHFLRWDSPLFLFFYFILPHGKKFQQLKQSYTGVKKWVKKKAYFVLSILPPAGKKIVQYNRLCTVVKREKTLSYHEKVG
jgi:hypothetical protein